MLLDKNGRPIRRGKPVYSEIASAAREDTFAGYLGDVRPTQDHILREQGGFDKYRRLLTDDQVMSTYQQRRRAITSREWIVQPGGTSAIDIKAAEWLEELIRSLTWDDILEKMHFGVFYGFGVGELMYARDGQYVTVEHIRVRDRSRFTWGREFDLRLIEPGKPQGEPMPPRKFWTFTAGADHHDDPWGMGLGHYLFWPVFLKRNGVKSASLYLERFAHPTPVGKYQPGTDPDEQRKLLEALAALTTDLGIVIPEGMQVEPFEAKRSGSADYQAFLERWDKAIAKINLSQTMTTDDGSSLAQGEVHMDVRDDVVKGDADLLCGSFNSGTPFAEGPLQWLMEWNFPGAAMPSFWYRFEEEEDRNAIAERDLKLFQTGWTRTQESMQATYGEGYERRSAAPPMPFPGGPPSNPPGQDPEFAESDAGPTAGLYAEAAGDRASKHVESWVDQIRRQLDEAGSLNEFAERLVGLDRQMPIDDVAREIGDGLEAAHLAGRHEAREGR